MENTTVTAESKVALPKYEARLKVETLEQIKETDKTQLEHSYTIWALVKQNRQSVTESYESVIKAVDTFHTVSAH